MSLLALYDPALRGRADAPALEVEDAAGTRTFTFGALDARSDRMAAAWRRRGVGPGDRVALLLANRLEFLDCWLAAMKLGAIAVPMNVLYKGREIGHIVQDAAPVAVVTTPDRASDLPPGAVLWDVDALSAEAEGLATARPAAALEATTPAALVYTSGTTGLAKGAVLTHGNFAANARALIEAWRITSVDRYLAVLPLFHVHGLGNGIQSWLATGCHMRLATRFRQEAALDWFEAYRPTLFFGVPTMYVRLLEAPPERARVIGAGVRLFVSGSAPLPAQVLEAFAARYGQRILERYGMTETLMNAGNPLDGERRAGTVGREFPGVAIEIRDEAGAVVPDGIPGEFWVRGPNVCAGYWRRPDATAAAFVDGWFRTGDLGVRDPADGYLTLQGRRSDVIISGGFNIYPREVEEVLLTMPGVREAAVAGRPDAVRGEVPVAYIVTEGPLDAAALEAGLRAELASFKIPRAFVRVEALPRTALGKVQKHLLPERPS
jgi:malonyl-CoA/methylmalonyl-CoA synthetase